MDHLIGPYLSSKMFTGEGQAGLVVEPVCESYIASTCTTHICLSKYQVQEMDVLCQPCKWQKVDGFQWFHGEGMITYKGHMQMYWNRIAAILFHKNVLQLQMSRIKGYRSDLTCNQSITKVFMNSRLWMPTYQLVCLDIKWHFHLFNLNLQWVYEWIFKSWIFIQVCWELR